jgi:hypothetical protein
MASKKLSLYLHPETEAHLIAAGRAGRTAGAEVRYLVEFYREIATRCVPELLDAHWSLLLEALADYRIERVRDVLMLPYVVDERIKSNSDLARRWRVDGETLAYRLRAMKIHELVALADALERRRTAVMQPG